MNKVLFYLCTIAAVILFGSSFSDIFSKWSDAMQALAIVLLLAGLRAASPRPMTTNKN
jgi:hypothetical protein